MVECVYKLRQNAEGTRAELQIAPRKKKKTGNGEKDLIIYKDEVTTKQALQQETDTDVSNIQPQRKNQGQGNNRSRPSKLKGVGGGGGSKLIPILILYIVYTQILKKEN